MSAGAKPGWTKGLRREHRISGCKPVTVLGKDALDKPFSQNTFTVEISRTGLRLQGLPPLACGTTLMVEFGRQQARYRVAWVGEKGSSSWGQVGLECIDHEKNIFEIEPASTASFYDEYKRVEAELHRSEDRFKRLFQHSLGLIYTHDLSGLLLTVNPAAAYALGAEPDTLFGRNLKDFLAPASQSQLHKYLARIDCFGQDSGYMSVLARIGGTRTWFYRSLLVREDRGPRYVIGNAMDITEQKELEHQLQSALVELQRAMAEVRTLRGLLPMCAWCRKIRNESGEWTDLESYVMEHSEAHFSHGVCSDCANKIRAGE
ncbi:MAG TPA: PAS domain S-box protein [Candidatus Sulfotelmatobacter sp.]|nr:PAS domain S-box protein [Candidatus Sulfotelmatobacter sp.]